MSGYEKAPLGVGAEEGTQKNIISPIISHRGDWGKEDFMSAYQKIVDLRNEIERLTGYRPHIELHFHGLTDSEAKDARDAIVASSDGHMESYMLDWTDGARTQNFYRAEDWHERIYLVAYGQVMEAKNAAS